jgi:hypothetical protein
MAMSHLSASAYEIPRRHRFSVVKDFGDTAFDFFQVLEFPSSRKINHGSQKLAIKRRGVNYTPNLISNYRLAVSNTVGFLGSTVSQHFFLGWDFKLWSQIFCHIKNFKL